MPHPLRKHIEELVRLSDEEFELISSCFTKLKAYKKEWLIRAGEPAPNVYFVVSGLLKLVFTDEAGKEFIVSFAMEDWWEGDFKAFFSHTNASLSLQCLEDCELYYIKNADYQKLCQSLPKVEHFFLEKANRGHITSQQRIISLLTLNAKQRYELLLQNDQVLLQRVPKSLIAAYLGVSRETLSRLAQ